MSDQGGRPTDYKPEYCQMLITHMAGGLSFESFAGLIDSTASSIYLWAKEHPEFSEAKAKGTVASRLFWERHGVEGLYSTTDTEKIGNNYVTKSKAINSKIWELNMKKRFHDWNPDLFPPKPDDPENDSTIDARPTLNIFLNGQKSS